jgi:peptidoglycan/xylan/chitin deacetylase (PgdA/CDA1 family)
MNDSRAWRRLVFCGALFAAFLPAHGQVGFGGLDLSPNDRLLFTASTHSPEFGDYDTLFLADPRERTLHQLTFFPERVLLLNEKETLQIQNRFGVFRWTADSRSLSPLPQFPAFVNGAPIQNGNVAPLQTSPNGNWLLYLKPSSVAFGDLMLFNVQTGAEIAVSRSVERSFSQPEAVWSPDSQYLVYGKGSVLYYFSITQMKEGRVPAESLRKIGDGKIANVQWGRKGNLYYIAGYLVYRMDASELFTRSLYAGFLRIGRIEGRIPFSFDPNFDSFHVSPDGKTILLNKGGRNIFLYALNGTDFHGDREMSVLPYLYLSGDTVVQRTLWSSSNVITLLTVRFDGGKRKSAIFRLTPGAEGATPLFQRMNDEGVADIVLSPEESLIALVRADGIVCRDTVFWEERYAVAHPAPLDALWISEEELLVAGTWYTERYNLPGRSGILVSLSQAEGYGFSRQEAGDILVRARDKVLNMADGSRPWTAAAAYAVREPSVLSPSYRVYLDSSFQATTGAVGGGNYRNLVMIRDAKGYGTFPLFTAETPDWKPYPDRDDSPDGYVFDHGSRIRRRELALVFNAVDSIEGLTTILNTLASFRLRCTFFVNGEFIRRFPDAVKEIADSGHEVGSLFYVYFNMTDSRFRIDKEFVKAGLARNEDDFFAATGRELSLLWHAPYYIVNSDIVAAGQEMNYSYIGRDIDPNDWVAKSETAASTGLYLPASVLAERVIEGKKPGSIVPFLVGLGEGGRDDYLFHRLDIIVNELIRQGYEIVPVSTLLDHAR